MTAPLNQNPVNESIPAIDAPKLKVYIAGKVSGEPYAFTLSKFGIVEQKLRAAGYDVFNPMTNVPPDADWKTAMKICLPALLDCDRVVALPCWRQSKGATLEVDLANKAGIPIIESV